MKVFGKFKCVFCNGTGMRSNSKEKCSSCNNGISNYLQEYRSGKLLLETCLCNKKGPRRKQWKWCVEVATLDIADDSPIWHYTTEGHKWIWCHDYEYDAWSGSLKYAYKKALKNGQQALARRSKLLMHNMIMRLLEL